MKRSPTLAERAEATTDYLWSDDCCEPFQSMVRDRFADRDSLYQHILEQHKQAAVNDMGVADSDVPTSGTLTDADAEVARAMIEEAVGDDED